MRLLATSRLQLVSFSNKLSHAASFTMSFHSAHHAHQQTQHTSLPGVSNGCSCTVTRSPSLAVIVPMCSCHSQTLGGCVARHGYFGQAPNCHAMGNTAFAASSPGFGSWMSPPLHQHTGDSTYSNTKKYTEVSNLSDAHVFLYRNG